MFADPVSLCGEEDRKTKIIRLLPIRPRFCSLKNHSEWSQYEENYPGRNPGIFGKQRRRHLLIHCSLEYSLLFQGKLPKLGIEMKLKSLFPRRFQITGMSYPIIAIGPRTSGPKSAPVSQLTCTVIDAMFGDRWYARNLTLLTRRVNLLLTRYGRIIQPEQWVACEERNLSKTAQKCLQGRRSGSSLHNCILESKFHFRKALVGSLWINMCSRWSTLSPSHRLGSWQNSQCGSWGVSPCPLGDYVETMVGQLHTSCSLVSTEPVSQRVAATPHVTLKQSCLQYFGAQLWMQRPVTVGIVGRVASCAGHQCRSQIAIHAFSQWVTQKDLSTWKVEIAKWFSGLSIGPAGLSSESRSEFVLTLRQQQTRMFGTGVDLDSHQCCEIVPGKLHELCWLCGQWDTCFSGWDLDRECQMRLERKRNFSSGILLIAQCAGQRW